MLTLDSPVFQGSSTSGTPLPGLLSLNRTEEADFGTDRTDPAVSGRGADFAEADESAEAGRDLRRETPLPALEPTASSSMSVV